MWSSQPKESAMKQAVLQLRQLASDPKKDFPCTVSDGAMVSIPVFFLDRKEDAGVRGVVQGS